MAEAEACAQLLLVVSGSGNGKGQEDLLVACPTADRLRHGLAAFKETIAIEIDQAIERGVDTGGVDHRGSHDRTLAGHKGRHDNAILIITVGVIANSSGSGLPISFDVLGCAQAQARDEGMTGAVVSQQGGIVGRVTGAAIGQVTEIDADKGKVNGQVAVAAAVAVGVRLGIGKQGQWLTANGGAEHGGAIVVIVGIVVDGGGAGRINGADQVSQRCTGGEVSRRDVHDIVATHQIGKEIGAINVGHCRQHGGSAAAQTQGHGDAGNAAFANARLIETIVVQVAPDQVAQAEGAPEAKVEGEIGVVVRIAVSHRLIVVIEGDGGAVNVAAASVANAIVIKIRIAIRVGGACDIVAADILGQGIAGVEVCRHYADAVGAGDQIGKSIVTSGIRCGCDRLTIVENGGAAAVQ